MINKEERKVKLEIKRSKKKIKKTRPIMRMLLSSNGRDNYNIINKLVWDNNGKLKQSKVYSKSLIRKLSVKKVKPVNKKIQ